MVLATEQPDGPTFAALIDALIDGVIDPLESAIYEGREHEAKVVAGGGVSARAACQDVLIQLGRTSLPKILQRLDPEDTRSSGTRLMVDMIGQLGGEAEIPILTKFLQRWTAIRARCRCPSSSLQRRTRPTRSARSRCRSRNSTGS